MSHKEVKKSTVRENSPKAFKKDYKNPERTVRKFSGFKSESDSDDDRWTLRQETAPNKQWSMMLY